MLPGPSLRAQAGPAFARRLQPADLSRKWRGLALLVCEPFALVQQADTAVRAVDRPGRCQQAACQGVRQAGGAVELAEEVFGGGGELAEGAASESGALSNSAPSRSVARSNAGKTRSAVSRPSEPSLRNSPMETPSSRVLLVRS